MRGECLIKGNISRSGRKYTTSLAGIITIGQKSVLRGERWFCSEAQARKAAGGKLKDEIKNSDLFVSPGRVIDGMYGAPKGITPISQFDVIRYQGKWYEIMRLDHRFEQGLSNVTALTHFTKMALSR